MAINYRDAITFDYVDLKGKRTRGRTAVILETRQGRLGTLLLTWDLQRQNFRYFYKRKMTNVTYP